MSINQIVLDEHKFWMDPYINSIKVDGDWEYKESEKSPGEYLVLNANLIANWGPLVGNLTGNVICTRLQAANVSTSYEGVFVLPYINFSPFFTKQGPNINIVQAGTYMIFSCPNFITGLNGELFSRIVYQSSPGIFTVITGSETSTPGGCTLFSSLNPVSQATNIPNVCILTTVNANTLIEIQLKSSINSSISGDFSYLIVYKIN